MFLGIDLTSSEKKPTALALLDSHAQVKCLTAVRSDAEILAFAGKHRPSTVAIDAPLGFPEGMCCLEESHSCRPVRPVKGRECERELAWRGIPLYFTTKRSIIKGMAYRAIGLSRDLAAQGRQVLEVYPYAAKVLLFGRPIPKKTTREGLKFLIRHLGRRIGGIDSRAERLDHDLCDALVATYVAYLASLGRTEALGLEEEARIVVPKDPPALGQLDGTAPAW